jgi:hypothetical protein
MSMDANKQEKIETWMLTIVQDGGVRRFDDLHIDKIDSAWGDKNCWIDRGLEAFRTAIDIRNLHQLPFAVGFGFSLSAGDRHRGVDFQTRKDFFEELNSSPPSLYLFDRGGEPDKRTMLAGGMVQNLDPAIFGLQGGVRCYYLEFKQPDIDEFSRSLFLEG